MIQSEKDKEVSLADKCDQIMLWCKKILRIWFQTLELRYPTQESKKTKISQDAYRLYR